MIFARIGGRSYSNEGNEPPLIHVEWAGAVAKFWLDPVSLPSSTKFRAHDCVGWKGLFVSIVKIFWRHGVTSSNPSVDPRVVDVAIDDIELIVGLADGRRLAVPLALFPRLFHAEQSQRENWQLVGDGEGIHWVDIDEDLSVIGLLRGVDAPGTSKRAV